MASKWVGFLRLIYAIPVILLIYTLLVKITMAGWRYDQIIPELSKLVEAIK